MIGGGAGLTGDELLDLLATLEPALLRDPHRTAMPAGITIVGEGETARLLAQILRQSELRMVPDGEETRLAIIIGHFVIEPEFYGHWLCRDLPHLPVVFGDTMVRIGPIIEPGHGPCLYCLQRYRTDADPAWPAIASQLWGQKSQAESVLVANEVAAIAARMVVERLRHDGASPAPGLATGSAIDLDAETGALRIRTTEPHPQCGCVTIDRMVPLSAAPPENGMLAAERVTSPRARIPRPPRRGAAADVPA